MTGTQSATRLPPAELPTQLTRFVGRGRELDELCRLLGTTRLLTLTGAGGSGKTRLAQEVAARIRESFERVVWVDLAPLVAGAPVPQQVAVTLRVHERGGSATEAVLDAIHDVPFLLILDNCEHLIDGCAELVETLLRNCGNLSVLATSREALGVPGETAWLTPALAMSEAIQLFVERAQAVLPTFTLNDGNVAAVTEVCRRLDGIPLAIELAAARIRVLSPEQIAERLNDAFRILNAGSRTALPRHRTLRGTMEWSYALLNNREQVLLRRLAVFAGGFSLEAAEAITPGTPLEPEDILDGVSALVDKSLVIMDAPDGEARYRLLETVRQYGVERLREAGELDELRRRHAAFFLSFAEEAAPHLFGGAGDDRWLNRMREESGNLRAAADWTAEEVSRNEAELRLTTAVHWFWFARGQFREGRQRLTSAIGRSQATSSLIRGRALTALGHLALWQGDLPAIRPSMAESVALLRDTGDVPSLAYALNGLGAAYYFEGNTTRADECLGEAFTLAETLRPTVLHALILYWRGRNAQAAGNFQAAQDWFERALQCGRNLHHPPAIAHPLAMLGRLALARGEYGRAFEFFHEGLGIHHGIEDHWGTAQGLEGLGGVAILIGRYDRGVRLLAAANTLREKLATPLLGDELVEHDRQVTLARQALGKEYQASWDRGRVLPLAEAVQFALAEGPPHTGEYRVPVAEPPTSVSENAPEALDALRVHALGPLQVYRGTELIDPTSWGSARPRELLIFLLMHPDGCTKEQVGLAFWPEASASQLRNSFHVALHRLRKTLGHPDWITLTGDRYRLDPAFVAEFDVIAFEREVTGALQQLQRKKEGAAAVLERALARYRGDLLDGEPVGDWHLIHRDHLQRLYIDGLLALGSRMLEEERFPKAAETFRRVLARDELHEGAWRSLMLCHARMGERAQALRLYQKLEELLAKELEAEPDEETTALFERIQRGDTP